MQGRGDYSVLGRGKNPIKFGSMPTNHAIREYNHEIENLQV